MLKRNKVVYIPYPIRGNKVNESQTYLVDILSKRYEVSGSFVAPADVIGMLCTKAVILNWVEEKLDNKMKLQLLLYQLSGAKVIWVFHNRMPHDIQEGSWIKENMSWLAARCNKIWLFSKDSRRYIPDKRKNTKKSVFIPHIMYKSRADQAVLGEIRTKYGISEQDFVFTIFGLIRPYKNIESGIEAFQRLGMRNAKLIIAGNPIDSGYAKQIKKICQDNQNIILDLQYISNTLLDGIIAISDVVLLPYQKGSSMNSGVMIQAFSNGKTVISPDICMARDFAGKGFLYRYRDSLEETMKKAYDNGKETNRRMGLLACHYMEQWHNEEAVSRKLYSMLE